MIDPTKALCFATEHSDPWFPNSAKKHQQRKALCLGCTQIAGCLELALSTREEHGVWAGTTPTERRRIRNARQKEQGLHPRPHPRTQRLSDGCGGM